MISFLHLPPADSPTMIIVNLVCVFVLAVLLIRFFVRKKMGGVKNARINNSSGNDNANNSGDNDASGNGSGSGSINS